MAVLRATVKHDTLFVTNADDAALELFRATREQLIGCPFIDLFGGEPDMRQLESLRLSVFRKRDVKFDALDLTFRRFDNTSFVGHTITNKVGVDEWETTIGYLFEG
jgi:hypothetical protein